MSVVAYYRVSTERQGRSGLGLEAQQVAVQEYARRTGQVIVAAFTEIESGRCRTRPVLAEALSRCRGDGLMLVVAKLDRLARDVSLILSLVDSGVRIHFLDLPDLSGDPIVGRLVLTVLAAIAEFEARRIGQRIREALARRRERNGTKPSSSFRSRQHRLKASAAAIKVVRRTAGEFRSRVRPFILGLRADGLTLAETADELNRLGIRTPTGKAWTLANVEVFVRGRNWKIGPPDAKRAA